MIDHVVHIAAPPEMVFDMLTHGDLLCTWMAVQATSEPRPGDGWRHFLGALRDTMEAR